MKKLFVLLLSMVFILTSCEFSKDAFNKFSQAAFDYTLNSEHNFIEKKAELLMNSIKDEDAAEIKNMFSQKAQSCDSDLDESIQLLISIVNKDFDGWVGHNDGSDSSTSYGIKKSVVHYGFKNDHIGYNIWMTYYRTHTQDETEIGIIHLCIEKSDECYIPYTEDWVDEIDFRDYGIYISEQVLADIEKQ